MSNIVNFSDHNRFFDNKGYLRNPIPQYIITAMPINGDLEKWAYWAVDELKFNAPRERSINWLGTMMGFDIRELRGRTDRDIAALVMWLVCTEIAHEGEFFGLVE